MPEWYSFKNALCEHMSCSSTQSGGQFHVKALQHRMKEERKNAKNMPVYVNVIGAGIEVCKMKASASKFESIIAFLAFAKQMLATLHTEGRNFKCKYALFIKTKYIYYLETFTFYEN